MATIFKPLACGFHSHVDIGSLDAGSTAESRIKRASEIGRIADAVTDHGYMSSIATHHMAAQKLYKDKKISSPVKSIHGIEIYLIDEDRPIKVLKNGKQEPKYYHLTIHFKTIEAYHYFCKMTPKMEERAVVKYGERKPLIYFHELQPLAGHITVGTGCLLSPVQQNYLKGNPELAERWYLKLKELAGPGNLFVEIFPHQIDQEWKRPVWDKEKKSLLEKGHFEKITSVRNFEGPTIAPEVDPCTGALDIQKGPNAFVLALSKKYGDPVIISLDDHYACKEDRAVQEARLGNGSENWRFYNYYHMLTSEEAAKELKEQLSVADREIEEWIDNSYLFVEKFDKYTFQTAKDRWLLPTTEMVYNVTTSNKSVLWEKIQKHGRMPTKDSSNYQVYLDRLKYEYEVLSENGIMDFLPYFFLLEDASSWAKETGVLMSLRGSAGGSLILYLLNVGITDPIKYDLPFERFLTVDRIKTHSLPDADVDIEDRNILIDYLFQKYGDSAALISTDQLLRLKNSIKDVERATLGSVRLETELMTKKILPAPQGISDKDHLFGYTDKTTGERNLGYLEKPEAEELRKWISANAEMWDTVQKCIGITKTRGVHAGGVIIAPGPVQNFMPVIKSSKGEIATAYNMKGVEEVGGVKYDFLGVSTLKALSLTLKSIFKTTGKKIAWEELPHDPEVYKSIIQNDKLGGIFQLNTNTAKPFVSKIKPSSIEEISALTALCRPGTLDAPSADPRDEGQNKSMADYYVECAQGRRSPHYIHEDLRPILETTFGVVLYQEHTLRIFRDIAGYTYGEAEGVRRAIGKKDKDQMDKHLGMLKTKCLNRGWTEEQAYSLCETLVASARYSFNKSHSTTYGQVAYNGAWLKHNYAIHFWLGELTIAEDDHDTLRGYLNECRDLLLPIDIIKSNPVNWTIEGDKIRPPLSLMKGVGAVATVMLRKLMTGEVIELSDKLGEEE